MRICRGQPVHSGRRWAIPRSRVLFIALTLSACPTVITSDAGDQGSVHARDVGTQDVSSRDSASLDIIAHDIAAHDVDTTEAGSPDATVNPSDHPRLFLTTERLAQLRASACFDGAGQPVADCTPSSQWNNLMTLFGRDDGESWAYALAYKVSQDPAYHQLAIDRLDLDCFAITARNYNWLYVRDAARNVALTYDWLHDELDPATRAELVDYANRLLYVTWNDNALTTELCNQDSHWSHDAAGNNFFYNYLLATAYLSLATLGENSYRFEDAAGAEHELVMMWDAGDPASVSYTDPLALLRAKVDDHAIPDWLEHPDRGRGGGWHEGDQYAQNTKRHQNEMFLMMNQVLGTDYFTDLNFPRESVYYEIYAIQPGFSHLYHGGDAGREATMSVSEYDRVLMLSLAAGLRGTLEGEYAQFWLDHPEIRPELTVRGIDAVVPFDFFFYQPGPTRDFSELPLSYRAQGLDWVNSRSSWESDAVSVTFMSSDKIIGHQHNDQNGIQIYKGAPAGSEQPGVRGWMITDITPYGRSLNTHTSAHNTLLVDDDCQRSGTGTGDLLRFQAAGDFTYAAGDASDAYYGDQQVACRSSEGTKQLQLFERELVHLLPDVVAIYDRVETLSPDSRLTTVFHYGDWDLDFAGTTINPPELNGTLLTQIKPHAGVFQRVLLPATASVEIFNQCAETEDEARRGGCSLHSWRVDITDPAPGLSHRFLSMLQITGPDTLVMRPATAVESSAGDLCDGALLEGAPNHLLLFSRTGAELSDTTYPLSAVGTTRHLVFNAVPTTAYTVTGPGVASVHIASAAGILDFTTSGSGDVAVGP